MLANYAGVKVGTHHRIEGLEFKVVFIPGDRQVRVSSSAGEGARRRRVRGKRDRSMSDLFVAMTRARDLLYVLSSGDPADLIADAADRFELVSRP